jgi:Mrp family chromosome partitioning ATPase
MQLRLHELNDEIRLAEGRSLGLAETVAEIQDKIAYLSAREKEFAAVRANQESARALEASLAAKVEGARVAALAGESPFMVLEEARPAAQPAPAGRRLILVAGLVLGLGLALGVALCLEIADPWMRDQADAKSIAADAASAEFDHQGSQRIVSPQQLSEDVLAWRRLVNSIVSDIEHGLLAVVPAPGGSAADAAWNIAATLAMKGKPTRLVDTLGVEPAGEAPGLVELLRDPAVVDDSLQPTAIARLQVLPTGDASAADPLWLGSPEMAGLAHRLGEFAGATVISLPSVIADETALEFAGTVGSAVVVARSGATARAAASETVALLEGRGVRTRVVVVLDVPEVRLTRTKSSNVRTRPQLGLNGVQHA